MVKKLIIIIIIFFTLLCTCFGNPENGHEKYPIYRYHYEVKIETNDNMDYLICVPILIEIDVESLNTNTTSITCNNISEVMNDLTIKGKATIKIMESIHGYCLQIIGRGNVIISSHGYEKVPVARLNMYNESYGKYSEYVDYWVKIESYNESIDKISILGDINYQFESLSGIGYISDLYIGYFYYDKILNGWNLYEGSHGMVYS